MSDRISNKTIKKSWHNFGIGITLKQWLADKPKNLADFKANKQRRKGKKTAVAK